MNAVRSSDLSIQAEIIPYFIDESSPNLGHYNYFGTDLGKIKPFWSLRWAVFH